MYARKILALILLTVLTVGCNIPNRPQAVQPTQPQVQMTLTAIFKTAMAEIPTLAPPAPSATPTRLVATSTAAPQKPDPTNTAKPASTATSAPTAVPPTSAPTSKPSPTQPGRPETAAPHVGSALTIDGDWAEWKKIAREYPAQYAVYGKGSRGSEDDLNASYYVGWDANFLYIAVKVRDDVYVQQAQGANIYKGDSIEILLDTDLENDLTSDVLSGDDYQVGISAGRPSIADANPEVYRWFPAGKAGSVSGATVVALQESGVYRVEAAIPWSVFGVTPAKGMRLGFAISVSDNDLPGEQVQQSMVSNVPVRRLTDPTTWGVLVLK